MANDAFQNLLRGIDLKRQMRTDIKRLTEEFRQTAQWTFDPTLSGFEARKEFKFGVLDPRWSVSGPFRWVADKVVRSADNRTTEWRIVRAKDGSYCVKMQFSDPDAWTAAAWGDGNWGDYHVRKAWDCEIPDADAFGEVVRQLGLGEMYRVAERD